MEDDEMISNSNVQIKNTKQLKQIPHQIHNPNYVEFH